MCKPRPYSRDVLAACVRVRRLGPDLDIADKVTGRAQFACSLLQQPWSSSLDVFRSHTLPTSFGRAPTGYLAQVQVQVDEVEEVPTNTYRMYA